MRLLKSLCRFKMCADVKDSLVIVMYVNAMPVLGMTGN